MWARFFDDGLRLGFEVKTLNDSGGVCKQAKQDG